KNKYDFYNLKVLLKAKLTFSKDEIPAFDIGNIPLEKIKEAVFENKLQSVPMLVERLIKEAEEEYMKTDSLFILETMLSNGYFEMIFNELNNINNDFLTSYYKTEVDLLNIIIACRSKIRHIKKTNLLEYLIKNGYMNINKLSQIYENSIQSWPNYFQKTDYEALVSEGIKYWQDNKSLTRIEILKDNFLLDLLKIGKYTSFGLESITGYIYAKENDIKNIRIILNAKKYLLSKNIIKNNIRDTYV
ncbi:MAG: V-type ATPase subunit, partial [Atribacterota bacterium]|nr:V-type ATPase subunit [Atribacterota bacterium]